MLCRHFYNTCHVMFILHAYDLTFTSRGGGEGGSVEHEGCQATDQCSTLCFSFWSLTTWDILSGDKLLFCFSSMRACSSPFLWPFFSSICSYHTIEEDDFSLILLSKLRLFLQPRLTEWMNYGTSVRRRQGIQRVATGLNPPINFCWT